MIFVFYSPICTLLEYKKKHIHNVTSWLFWLSDPILVILLITGPISVGFFD